jgi:subtilisin family serine protease
MTKKKLFKTVFLILFLSVCITSGISQRDEKISLRMHRSFDKNVLGEKFVAWIYFRDKGPGKLQKMHEAKMTLNVKSLNRRLRHGFENIVDEYDLPVYQPYVHLIEQYVHKIRHTSRWLNAVSVEASRQSLEMISEFRSVKKIDEVRVYTYSDPEVEPKTEPVRKAALKEIFAFDYGTSFAQVDLLNVPPLHDLGFSGRGVLICMLDGGFNNLGHESLDHLDIVATWDFVNGDPLVFDEEGQMGTGDHGTNTLGTLAGFEPGQLIGPAFGASFILGKTENNEYERHLEEDHWIAGAEWADTLGADIISSSLGYRDQFTQGEGDYSWQDMDGETTIVAKGANIAASRGILIVNSAGNEGRTQSGLNTLVSPSDSDHVMAAGAVDSQGTRVGFSSIGPTADGRIKPDVMAMGEAVYTAAPNGPAEYELVNGTSFACPLVAGVAALILEINPSWTNQDVMTALKSTASLSESPDNLNGWGVLDAQKAAAYPLKNLHAPQDFAVSRIPNDYGFFIQFVDRLTWTANPQNGGQVTSYRVYAKQVDTQAQDQAFTLIAEVDGQTFNLLKRGILEEETFLYKITSVNASGEESDPNYTLR